MRRAYLIQQVCVAALVVLAAVLELWLSQQGSNWDFGCWQRVGKIAATGGNFYAEAYTMGPIWAWICGGTTLLGLPLREVLCVVLITANCLTFYLLQRWRGTVAGLVYLFCPVILTVTGYHGQVEPLAVALGLFSWLAIGMPFVAGLVFGLSLASKHVFFFLPLALVLRPDLGVWAKVKWLLGGIVSTAALIGPVAYAWWPMFNYHVFGLHVKWGTAWVGDAVLPLVFASLHVPIDWRYPWVIAVVLVLCLYAWRNPGRLFEATALSIVAFSPAMSDQYLVIPMVACAAMWRRASAWTAILAASLTLSASPDQWGWLSAATINGGQLSRFQGFVFCQVALWGLLLDGLMEVDDGP